MEAESLRRAYAGRHVLVTGCTGFVGKVWLAMALDRLPEIGRIYVLARRKRQQTALQRFENIVSTSPVFGPLHEKHGPALGEFLGRRVEVVAGDISEPNLGLDPAVADRLVRDLDLVVNCAGLVDFTPGVDEAIATNATGALHALTFVQRCRRAALLHISTCFVCGNRSGLIPETLTRDYCPKGLPFDAEAEYADVLKAVERIHAWEHTPEAEEAATQEAMKRIHGRGRDDHNARLVRNMVDRGRRMRTKHDLIQEGMDRARRWGWTNTYTYSKSLAESLLLARANETRMSVLRPAVVESAVSFPLAGWNEGFNTTAPLIYLLGTWFRHLPADPKVPFDVVPVDLVCNGMTIAGAALMQGRHAPVYHCGTSDRNPLKLGRATELTTLGKRKHLRKNGAGALEKHLLSRWDCVTVDDDTFFSVANMRDWCRRTGEFLRSQRCPQWLRDSLDDFAHRMEKAVRELDQVEGALEIFRPFIHDNRPIFTARAFDAFPVAEEEFRFRPEDLDWRTYWIDVHMPGLRHWCFPKLEGKELKPDRPSIPFRLLPPPTPAREPAAATGS